MAKKAITHPIRTRGYPTAGKASAWQAKKVKVGVLNKNTTADQVGNLACRLSAHDSSHPPVLKNEKYPCNIAL
jgi:hypothetical protein